MDLFGKKVYTIAADYNYGQITAAWVKRYVEQNGGEVVETEFFPLDVTQFGATISKIQAAAPDMVMSVLVGTGHLGFYRQWAASGMKSKIPNSRCATRSHIAKDFKNNVGSISKMLTSSKTPIGTIAL